jgi:AraC-like DNA-binding protein
LEEIAKEIKLVPVYFSAFFRKATGYSVFEYINEYRIYKACELLKETKKPVLEIAYETGYNSISLFNRLFRRITGISPRKYRNQPNILK